MSIDELTRLKKKVEDLKTVASHNAGALEQVLIRLKTEYGCDTIEAAERELKKRTRETDKAEQDFQAALQAFKVEHGSLLE